MLVGVGVGGTGGASGAGGGGAGTLTAGSDVISVSCKSQVWLNVSRNNSQTRPGALSVPVARALTRFVSEYVTALVDGIRSRPSNRGRSVWSASDT